MLYNQDYCVIVDLEDESFYVVYNVWLFFFFILLNVL